MLQRLIFFFKIHMDTRKNVFEICRQLGHVPSKRFARPVIGVCLEYGNASNYRQQ